MSEITLSIVIPAYNEEVRILPTLETIRSYLDQQTYSWEVLVVDDCSRDRTRGLVAGFVEKNKKFTLLTNDRNLGKGAAVKKGMLKAHGSFRLFFDADLSIPIEEIDRFFAEIKNYDIVIGSRRVAGAVLIKRQPVVREASGRIFSVLVRLFTLRGFLDTQCGFKMFTAKAAQAIFPKLTIERFGFDVEALFIAKKRGFKIKEAPVRWVDSPQSQVRLWRDASRMFLDLFRIRLNNWRNLY